MGTGKKCEVTEDEHQDTDLSNFFQKRTKVIRKASRAGKNDIMECVCYNPLDQEEQADVWTDRRSFTSQALVFTMMSAGGTTWQDISSQGGSWSVLMVTSK